MDNTWYIIRCDLAGVFFGHIKERSGSEATLTDVRRLWYWSGPETGDGQGKWCFKPKTFFLEHVSDSYKLRLAGAPTIIPADKED